MKKITSILLSVTMLLGTAALTVNAASADKSSVGGHNFSVIEETELNDGQIRLYTYNFTDNNPEIGIRMTDTALNLSKNFYFNDIDEYKQINMSAASVIEHSLLLDGGFSGVTEKRYNSTGGTYEKMRIKLSDYNDYFTSDGTHTEADFNNTFSYNYNFSTQNEGKYTYKSALVFFSGGIFTAVTPSKDGYAEFYVSRNIGEETTFSTIFSRVSSDSYADTGGANNSCFSYFTMGNADVNSYGVDIDDATAIQSYSAGLEDFDELQKRNADVTGDGIIDVEDATTVQKYLAGFNVNKI